MQAILYYCKKEGMCAQGPATPGPDYANFTKNMSIAKLTYDDFIDVYKYC